MTDQIPTRSSSSILRLRAGLLVLAASVLLCGSGGWFVARTVGLGLGWAILIAILIWIGVGVAMARLNSKIYFGIALAITLLLAYLVYDFCTGALGWSSMVSALLAAGATALMAFAFQDFRRIKSEISRWAFRR